MLEPEGGVEDRIEIVRGVVGDGLSGALGSERFGLQDALLSDPIEPLRAVLKVRQASDVQPSGAGVLRQERIASPRLLVAVVRSTWTCGFVNVRNLDIQGPDSLSTRPTGGRRTSPEFLGTSRSGTFPAANPASFTAVNEDLFAGKKLGTLARALEEAVSA
jgi:hypothetical protein